MKLCPQCEFIYEDDQSFCDMDGKELVFGSGALAFAEDTTPEGSELHDQAAAAASLTANLPPPPTGWQSRSTAIAAIVGIILAALLFGVYYARTHQPRPANANQATNQRSTESSSQATTVTADAQAAAIDSASGEQSSANSSPEVTGSQDMTSDSTSSTLEGSLSRARLGSNPVSAERSAAESSPSVIIWLMNGASIKADEAWERKDGVWYRQAGLVAFLNRSDVRSIQRLPAPSSRSTLTADNTGERNRKAENAKAQNQSRPVRPEAAGAKKESKVTSFLKKTGRMLKKPFQL
jgi:hypothetical protein